MPGPRSRVIAVAVTAAIAILAPNGADAALLSARNGKLAAFSGGISQLGGTLTTVGGRYGTDTNTFAATFSGATGTETFAATSSGAAASGVASASFKVHWKRGQRVTYGAAFYLPARFHSATTGQQALMIWDSVPGAGGREAEGGIAIDYATNRGYLVSGTATGQAIREHVLARPFALPIGRWFTLQVRQLLASGSAAYSEVYLNRKLIVSSRAPDLSVRRVSRVRYGIVRLSGGAQQGAVSLDFDRALATSSPGYVSPLAGDRYSTGRTDMGVDFCLRPGEPIRAIGDGVVVGISPDWFAGEPYIWYRLLDGPYAGRYVYVSEQITGLARVGTQLSAGQPLAYYRWSGTCIETGWSAADGATLAQATTGYHEGQVTAAGVSFAHFLISLGVQGRFKL